MLTQSTAMFEKRGREAVRGGLHQYQRDVRRAAQVWLLEQDAIAAAERRRRFMVAFS
jgi:hypothetical protein